MGSSRTVLDPEDTSRTKLSGLSLELHWFWHGGQLLIFLIQVSQQRKSCCTMITIINQYINLTVTLQPDPCPNTNPYLNLTYLLTPKGTGLGLKLPWPQRCCPWKLTADDTENDSNQYQLGAAEGVSLLCNGQELEHSQTSQEILPLLHRELRHLQVTAVN